MSGAKNLIKRSIARPPLLCNLVFCTSSALTVLLAVVVFLFFPAQESKAGDLVSNKTIGFCIKLPDGWVRQDADSFYENLGRIELDDPELQKRLLKHASVPALIATKHPEPYDDLNPSLKLNVRPYGNLKTREPVEIISLILGPLKKALADSKVVAGPEKVKIGDQDAAHVTVEYTLQSDAGSFATSSQLWIVPTQHFFYMIGIGYKQGESVDASSALASVMSFRSGPACQQ